MKSDRGSTEWIWAQCGRTCVGFGHLGQWERIAVVTDIDWIKHAMQLFGFLLPSKTEVFGVAQATDAKAWIVDENIN